ncbi:MAG: dihydroorotate dehydrogenase electron transfer subunit [Candidatus Omnitrophica bacterium]|nr:dihydroorotate dehydrogenase electron transfer subunit [Candidatus Omnitrophota bacterium]
MLQIKTKITYNKKIKGSYFRIALKAPGIAVKALPGQFINIKVSDSCEPLLRRPFGVHRVKKDDIEALYEVVGPATQILSQRKPGEYLDVIGPLGNGFTPVIKNKPLNILIAGGMGVAPLVFLAEKLKKSKNVVLIGAKTKEQIMCEKEFKDLGCEVKVATDDGSTGFKGYVSGFLEEVLSGAHYPKSVVYACGPRPMLKEISRISKKYNISAQVSLEEHMACGVGACLGCVTNTRSGFKRVCKEGPVFNGDEIIW